MNQDIYAVVESLQGQVADISYIMLAAARSLAHSSGGDVVAVLLGNGSQGLANTLAADRVIYVRQPGTGILQFRRIFESAGQPNSSK